MLSKLINPIYIYVLIRSWKAFEYFDKCVDSVLSQSYKNFQILFIDDASGYTIKQKNYIKNKLKGHVVIFNKERKYSVYNGYMMLHKYAYRKNSIVLILDGDDWLISNKTLATVANTYISSEKPIYFTYGESLIWNGDKYLDKPARAAYPPLNNRYNSVTTHLVNYRKEGFRVFHPMTFRTDLFKKIKKSDFMENSHKWLKYCIDMAAFFPMLEMANGKYEVLTKPMYVYNQSSSYNNTKANPYEFVRESLFIRTKKKYEAI